MVMTTRQKRQSLLKFVIFVCVVVSTYMAMAVYHTYAENKEKLDQNGTKHLDFVSKDEYTIPEIIHLYWPTEEVPTDEVPWMRKWRTKNPDFEVWYWTDDAVRRILARNHPRFLQVFDNFSKKKHQRALAIRYFLLYTFGGVFADLDVEPLKSLAPVLLSKQCVFADEHPVHKIANWHKLKEPVVDAVMACRPKHGFFKFAVEKISKSTQQDYVGTKLLTDLLKEYKAMNTTEVRTLTYKPHAVFIPSFDKLNPNVKEYARTCFKYGRNSVAGEWCRRVHDKRFCNCPMGVSVTMHHWQHPFSRSNPKTISVRKIMPDAKIMMDVLKMEKMSSAKRNT